MIFNAGCQTHIIFLSTVGLGTNWSPIRVTIGMLCPGPGHRDPWRRVLATLGFPSVAQGNENLLKVLGMELWGHSRRWGLGKNNLKSGTEYNNKT